MAESRRSRIQRNRERRRRRAAGKAAEPLLVPSISGSVQARIEALDVTFYDSTLTGYVLVAPYEESSVISYLTLSLWPRSTYGELLASSTVTPKPGPEAVKLTCASSQQSSPDGVISRVSGTITPSSGQTYYFYLERVLYLGSTPTTSDS